MNMIKKYFAKRNKLRSMTITSRECNQFGPSNKPTELIPKKVKQDSRKWIRKREKT